MKIKRIYTAAYDLPDPVFKSTPRREPWTASGPVANPMTRYSRYAEYRPGWMPKWPNFWCVAEAEDGTLGFALGNHGKPVAAVIQEYLGPLLSGEDCMAVEKVYDMAVRACAPFGAAGLASYAVSAIDLALWDLKGKLLDMPVYQLLGGPAHDDLFCYATGNDTDWHMELGFRGTKMACPYGVADGLDGIKKNVEFIAGRRQMVGDDVDLMLDCWMAFDVEYCVRLAEELRPYKLKWMEETLRSEDLDAHARLRQRLPWQTLATGEHWYTTYTFQHAAAHGLVDILQPDINWVGGMTAIVKIAAIAEAAGIAVIPHGGGGTPYGQHACYALPAIPWAECYTSTPPGVPLEEDVRIPGTPVAKNGRLTPSDGPGFGVDLDPARFAPMAG